MKKLLSISLAVMVIMSTAFATVAAAKKTEVTFMTMPFGTSFYMLDSAVESLFNEENCKADVSLKLKQTPGAMYIAKSFFQNEKAMQKGEIPFQVTQAMAPVLPYMIEGRWPFKKIPLTNLRTICGGLFMVNVFVTFDPDIKTPADLADKKVGFAERARVFQSILPNKPYFDKLYGGFDKVNWQYLGANNSKDALLNGSIDAAWLTMTAKVEINDQGQLVCTKAVPSPPLLELMSAGRPLHFVSENAAKIKSAYDPAKDFVLQPILVQKGSLKDIKHSFTARGMAMGLATFKSMPDDLVVDIVTTIFSNLDRLASYNQAFALYPKNPYPIGLDPQYAHPGLLKALKKMGMEIPKVK